MSSMSSASELPPFTTKVQLRETHFRDQLNVPENQVVRYHASSGSTGTPTIMAYTQDDLDLLGRLTSYAFKPLQDSVSRWCCYNAFGYGLFTGGLSLEEAARMARRELGLDITVIPASNQPGLSIKEALTQHLRMIDLFQPTVLFCTPSLAYALWEMDGLDTFEALIIGGEASSPALRNLLSNQGGRQVVEIYGLSEIIGPGVGQGCSKGALHLNENAFDIEIIDSELVISTVHNQAMTRQRFLSGDRVRSLSCDCGHPYRAIDVLGRSEDYITALSCYVSQFEQLLIEHGYAACFEIIDNMIRIEPRHAGKLHELPHLALPILVVSPGTLTRAVGKSKRYLQS